MPTSHSSPSILAGGRPKQRFRSRHALVFSHIILMILLCIGEIAARILIQRFGDPVLQQTVLQYRAIAQGATSRYEPAPFVNYRLVPGYKNVSGGANTRHNAAGFRDSFEYELEKAPGTLRIICLGGSTTYGVSVHDNRDTYPAHLARELNRRALPAGVERVEVFNMGVGGYTSAEVLASLQNQALSYRPDLVLIQCAINDVAPRLYDSFDCSYRDFRKPMRRVSTGFFHRMIARSTLCVALGSRLGWLESITLQDRTQYPMPPAARVVQNLATHGTDCYRRNLVSAIASVRATGAQVWVMTQAYLEHDDFHSSDADQQLIEQSYREGLTQHNAVIRDLAGEWDSGLVDLDQETPRQRNLFSDPIHMTAQGNATKARLIADGLVAFLSGEMPPVSAKVRGPGQDQ